MSSCRRPCSREECVPRTTNTSPLTSTSSCPTTYWRVRDVAARKFTARQTAIEHFLDSFGGLVEVVATPAVTEADETVVRDVKDRPVLRAARAYDCDVIATGDKDLLEADIAHPEILSPGTLLQDVHERRDRPERPGNPG